MAIHFLKMELSGKERGVSTIKLAKALECIESALSGVLNRIQQLNDESLQAKEEISQTFGRQISHLHNRETQLLRQVGPFLLNFLLIHNSFTFKIMYYKLLKLDLGGRNISFEG